MRHVSESSAIRLLSFGFAGEPLAATHRDRSGPSRYETNEWSHEKRLYVQDAAKRGRIFELRVQLLSSSIWNLVGECFFLNQKVDRPVVVFEAEPLAEQEVAEYDPYVRSLVGTSGALVAVWQCEKSRYFTCMDVFARCC